MMQASCIVSKTLLLYLVVATCAAVRQNRDSSETGGAETPVLVPKNSTPNAHNNLFDDHLYDSSLRALGAATSHFHQLVPPASREWVALGPHCDKHTQAASQSVPAPGPYPGGITQRSIGADLAKSMLKLSQAAAGPEGAATVASVALARQGLATGAGLVQSVIAAALHIIPPMIPPPAWTNQPLPCAPMVTGHNCFGAVLYPITFSDFMIADVTDSMMDGYIGGFPNTYATKVGKTSDAIYKGCFAAYMSMHCSSIFPRCTVPSSRNEQILVGGRAPTCLHLCVMPLIMCPGFWVGDIAGPCQSVAVPPQCTQAFFWNLWRLPPQYKTFDEANPFPRNCPSDVSDNSKDASDDTSLYDLPATPTSPIIAAASLQPPVQGVRKEPAGL